MEGELNILAWNCRSILSKLSDFKIGLYTIKPHIVCLSETWLRENRESSFINYRAIYKHRHGQAGGGIAILVRSDLATCDKPLMYFPGGKLEIQAIRVICDCLHIDLINLYNPSAVITENEFDFYFRQFGPNKVVIGDFNAHHNNWDTRHPSNTTGNNLVSTLFNHPSLSLLTPVSLPTYCNPRTGIFSTLDLCFVSAHFLPMCDIYTEREMGSDHDPVDTSIRVKPSTQQLKTRRRWKFGTGTWSQWCKALPPPKLELEFDKACAFFTESVVVTAEKCFKRTKEVVTPKYTKPWWSDKCEEVVRERHRFKNVFRRHPTVENMIAMRRAEFIAKYTINPLH